MTEQAAVRSPISVPLRIGDHLLAASDDPPEIAEAEIELQTRDRCKPVRDARGGPLWLGWVAGLHFRVSVRPGGRRKARRALRVTRAASALAACACAVGAFTARGAGEVAPGAYCPLPKAGEVPKCLQPAREEYRDFFAALDRGGVGNREAARLEADVAGGAASQRAYLALSSLSYGYYQLARQAAAAPSTDPAVTARLERWNTLLASAYETSPDDAEYREAVRTAALELHERALVRLGCVDAQGEPSECDSTEAVLRGFDAADDEVGFRGALRRLFQRIAGGGS